MAWRNEPMRLAVASILNQSAARAPIMAALVLRRKAYQFDLSMIVRKSLPDIYLATAEFLAVITAQAGAQ
jgi:hypothetical protein